MRDEGVERGGVALSAVALVVMSGVGASAKADDHPHNETVAAIDAAKAHVPDRGIKVASPDTDVNAGNGVSVQLASDAKRGIAIDGPGANDVQVGLPFAAQASSAAIEDGSVVYDNNNGSTTTPLVHEDGSVQILTTITEASAPTEYRYVVDAASGGGLVLTDDGGVDVVGADGFVVSHVLAPWAVDANGNSVPTHFSIDGDNLTQIIEHDPGTAYPVVADPRISFGWAVYVKYSKSEVRSMVSGLRGSLSSKAKYGSVLCLGIPNIYAAGLCGLLTYDMMDSIYRTFVSANAYGRCVEIQLAYVTYVPVNWKTYTC